MTRKRRTKSVEADESPRFSVSQLIDSNRYRKYSYLLEVYLDNRNTYTIEEVDKLIEKITLKR